jgi:hypothetical protein
MAESAKRMGSGLIEKINNLDVCKVGGGVSNGVR